MQVDSNKDGLVDLKDLSTALSKWLVLIAYPGSQDLLHPFTTARDIALDFFIAMKKDPRRCCHSDLVVSLIWKFAIPGFQYCSDAVHTSSSSKRSHLGQSHCERVHLVSGILIAMR